MRMEPIVLDNDDSDICWEHSVVSIALLPFYVSKTRKPITRYHAILSSINRNSKISLTKCFNTGYKELDIISQFSDFKLMFLLNVCI